MIRVSTLNIYHPNCQMLRRESTASNSKFEVMEFWSQLSGCMIFKVSILKKSFRAS